MSTTPGRATKLKSYVHTDKATVLITDNIFRQIQIMHNLAEGNEWSGILFYRVVSGSIEDPSTFVIRLEKVLPMDIGNPTYTEYDFDLSDEVVANAIDETMADPTLRYGHIHSHVLMQCFFSGTDIDECEDNCDKYDNYVSIIINKKNDMEKNWCGRICIAGEEVVSGNLNVTTRYNIGAGSVNSQPISRTEKIIKNIDCIIKPDPNSFWEDIDRSNDILTKKRAVVTTTSTAYGSGSTYYNNNYNNRSIVTTPSVPSQDSNFKEDLFTKFVIAQFLFKGVYYAADASQTFGWEKDKPITKKQIQPAMKWFKSLSLDEFKFIVKEEFAKSFRVDLDIFYATDGNKKLNWIDYSLIGRIILLMLEEWDFPTTHITAFRQEIEHIINYPISYDKDIIKKYCRLSEGECVKILSMGGNKTSVIAKSENEKELNFWEKQSQRAELADEMDETALAIYENLVV